MLFRTTGKSRYGLIITRLPHPQKSREVEPDMSHKRAGGSVDIERRRLYWRFTGNSPTT
jgi:hypothetical protein